MEMVELALVEDRYDIRELRSFIERHYAETQSPKAKLILDNWEEYLPNFIKVTPIEYRRVIIEKRLAELMNKQKQAENHQE